MTGQKFYIDVPYGLGTRNVEVTVIRYLGNDEYELECEHGNRYIRKLVWQELDY